MRSKLFIRQLPALNPDKLKATIPQQVTHQHEEIKETLKTLMGCVLTMTQQIRDLKVGRFGGDGGKIGGIGHGGRRGGDLEDSLDQRMEKRFQDINFDIPELKNDINNQERQQQILSWLTKICKTIFSIGFNLYQTQTLTIHKVKAYCSQNILRNLLHYCQKNHLTESQIFSINEFLQQDLLPYFCQKYPQSEQTETSAKFSSDLIQRDGMEDNCYDLVYRSKVDFCYQDSGSYNSQIMKFLNYLIFLPNKEAKQDKDKDQHNQKEKKEKALNQLFFSDMERIFRMVEVENSAINMQKYNPKKPVQFQWTQDQSSQKQKQQYQQKVKSYTSFQIGQKLSKNMKPYTDFQIQSGNLKLNNAEVMRVMTKWCQELQKCLLKSTIMNRETPFRMKDGSQKYLSMENKGQLIYELQKQKQKIDEQIKFEINRNNFKHQSQLLQRKANKQLQKLSQSQAIVGQFASVIFKNNESYLIYYLNTLIHAINTACKNFSTTLQLPQSQIPQLITFTIGDLLRCKCSSKQKQIIALYKQIQRIHRLPHSYIKIIRVKNRLNKGNKDILINLLYRGEMVVQMQLAIKSDKSKFIECSYNFNHYLYELKRAQFGPIMEMCNVWINKDLKSKYYLQKMQKLNKRKPPKPQPPQSPCCTQSPSIIKLPFRCNTCSCFYSSSSQVQKNIYCPSCHKYTCFLCQLQSSQDHRQNLFNELKQISDKNYDKIEFLSEVPSQGGLLINLKSKMKNGRYFFTWEVADEGYFFQFRDKMGKQEVIFLAKFKFGKIPESFLKENLVCSCPEIRAHVLKIKSKAFETVKQYFINKYLKQAYECQKSSIYLVDKYLTQANIAQQKTQCWPNVTEINLSQNRFLNDISGIVQKFPNARLAVLNKIGLVNIPQNIWPQLKILHLQRNNLQTVPNLTPCKKLKQLNISHNSIVNLPQNLQNWQHLKILQANYNKLKSLPSTIGELVSLESLVVRCNQLKELPEGIGRLGKLRKLAIGENSVTVVGKEIGNLVKLEELSLDANQLQALPVEIGALTSLKALNLSYNKITSLPEQICNLIHLQTLHIQNNQLENLPQNIGKLTNLTSLTVQKNKMSHVPPSIGKLINLTEFIAFANDLTELPEEFCQLESLFQVDLRLNKLGKIPQGIGKLGKVGILDLGENLLGELPGDIGGMAMLRVLRFDKNKLTSLPESIGKLKLLTQLAAYQNNLTEVPPSLFTLPSLQTLTLSYNNLRSIPETIGQLHNLQILNLQVNRIEHIPESIGNLKKLHSLNLSWNRIRELPEGIWQLGLREFYVRENLLGELSGGFGGMKEIKVLDISMNNIQQIPPQTLQIPTLQTLILSLPKPPRSFLPTLQSHLKKSPESPSSSLSLSWIQISYYENEEIDDMLQMAKLNGMDVSGADGFYVMRGNGMYRVVRYGRLDRKGLGLME